MIPIEKEPPEFFLNLSVYEQCYFCSISTPYWHKKSNTPVCEQCAQKRNESEIQKKSDPFKA